MKANIFKKIAILFVAITVLKACEPDGLLLFEKAPDVYFTTLANTTGFNPRANDSINVRFFFLTASETVVHIPISVTGRLSDQDRLVNVTVDESVSTALPGVHYELPASVVMRAGRVVDTLSVRIFRDVSLGILREEVVLVLELQPNAYFGTDFRTMLNIHTQQERSLIRYHIYISDILVRPRAWLEGYLGIFSERKLLLISELSGLSPAFMDFQYAIDGSYVTPWDVRAAAAITRAYLERRAADGDPVYEDRVDPITGLPVRMTMGPGA